jgi:histidine ammonia-lyase
MGVHAADKLQRIVENVRTVLAIELCCATQGISLRAPLLPADALSSVFRLVRSKVPELIHDRPLHVEIEAVRTLCENGSILAAARQHLPLH